MTWIVYVLEDPRTPGDVRYVGVTQRGLACRLQIHLSDSRTKNHYTARWIRSLAQGGVKPVIREIDSGEGDRSDAERHWIRHYRAVGARLTNHTDGGEGWTKGMRHRPESIAKMRAIQSSRTEPEYVPRSPEVAARRVDLLKATWEKKRSEGWEPPPDNMEARAKTTAALVGHLVSEETRRKISDANRGRVMSAEARAKMSVAKKGKPPPNKGKPGKRLSPESEAKRVASYKAAVACRRALKSLQETQDDNA